VKDAGRPSLGDRLLFLGVHGPDNPKRPHPIARAVLWIFAFLLLLDLLIAAFGDEAGYVVGFVIFGIILAARRSEQLAALVGWVVVALIVILFFWGLLLGGGDCVGWGCG
jgi:hypothetical protein